MEAFAEDGKVNVGGPAGVGNRFYGAKPVGAVFARNRVAKALKIGIGAASVPGMIILAQAVALPNFNPGPAEWASLLVRDSTEDLDHLALGPL